VQNPFRLLTIATFIIWAGDLGLLVAASLMFAHTFGARGERTWDYLAAGWFDIGYTQEPWEAGR
jgi:hypothetical protein